MNYYKQIIKFAFSKQGALTIMTTTLHFPLKLFLIIFLLSPLFLIGCKDKLVSPSLKNIFYPISVGNNWEYEITVYDSTGTIERVDTITESIIYERSKDGEPVYQFYSPLNPPSPACCDYKYYLQNKTDGVHALTSSDSLGYWIYDYLVYKYPCSKNDFFTNGRNDFDTTFVVSINDTVISDAGNFSCIVYKNIYYDLTDTTSNNLMSYSYAFVSKSIGKIKYEFYSTNSINQFYKKFEYSLLSYSLNN